MRRIASLIWVAAACATFGGPCWAQETAFYRDLFKKEEATFGDAVQVTRILYYGKDENVAFADAVADLKSKGIIPTEWDVAADSRITKGMAAYLVAGAMELEGGVTLRLFGRSERYALRECAWLGLMRYKSASTYVTGRELLAILTRCTNYRKEEGIAPPGGGPAPDPGNRGGGDER